MASVVSFLAEFFKTLAQQYGALGIGISMFAESAGVPFASALVVLTAGNMISSGKLSYWGAVAASTVGISLGSLFSYSVGYFGLRVGKVIRNTLFNGRIRKIPSEKSKLVAFLDRYGNFSILFAQLFGTTRTFISFPAGAMQLNLPLFVAYTTVGGAIFSIIAISFSMLINRFAQLLLSWANILLKLPFWAWPIMAVVVGSCLWAHRTGRFPFSLISRKKPPTNDKFN